MDNKSYMSSYQYHDKAGNIYNCRSGHTGRFIDLSNIDFLSDNEVSINTTNMVKQQNHLHTYKKTVDYIDNKSVVLKLVKSIGKLFRLF